MPFCEAAVPPAILKETDRQRKTLAILKNKLALTRPSDPALGHRFATYTLNRNNMTTTICRPKHPEGSTITRWSARMSPLKPSIKEEDEGWRGRLLSRVWLKPAPSRKRCPSDLPSLAVATEFSTGRATTELGQHLHNLAPQIFRADSSRTTPPRTTKEWNLRYLQDQGAVMGWERIIREILKRNQVVGKARGGLIWTYASTTEGMDKADELMRGEFESLTREDERGRRSKGSKVQLTSQRVGLAICGPLFRIYVYDIPTKTFHPPIRADLGGRKRLEERTFDLCQARSLSFLSAAAAAVRQAARGLPIERSTLITPRYRNLVLGLPAETILPALSPTPSLCRTASDGSSIDSIGPTNTDELPEPLPNDAEEGGSIGGKTMLAK